MWSPNRFSGNVSIKLFPNHIASKVPRHYNFIDAVEFGGIPSESIIVPDNTSFHHHLDSLLLFFLFLKDVFDETMKYNATEFKLTTPAIRILRGWKEIFSFDAFEFPLYAKYGAIIA